MFTDQGVGSDQVPFLGTTMPEVTCELTLVVPFQVRGAPDESIHVSPESKTAFPFTSHQITYLIDAPTSPCPMLSTTLLVMLTSLPTPEASLALRAEMVALLAADAGATHSGTAVATAIAVSVRKTLLMAPWEAKSAPHLPALCRLSVTIRRSPRSSGVHDGVSSHHLFAWIVSAHTTTNVHANVTQTASFVTDESRN